MSIQESDFEDELDEVSINKYSIGEYVGERLDDGTRDGFGRALLPNGDQYEGEYRHGLRNGKGCYQFRNGSCYSGEWKKGLKDGLGNFHYPDGGSYCGSWKQGKKHGCGKYIYQNGDIYEGSWKQDIRHGIGTYKSQESVICFNATWIDGSIIGPIEIFYPNYRYHGYWNKTCPVGKGVYSFGTKYMLPGHVGMFKNPDYVDSIRSSNEMLDGKTSLSKEAEDEQEEVGMQTLGSSNQNLTNVNLPKCLPHFIAHEITQYDYSHLPQHPIPPPESDSEISICTKSSSSALDETHLNQVHSPSLVSSNSIQNCNQDENEDVIEAVNEINDSDGSEKGHE